jgi:hypothetical protein
LAYVRSNLFYFNFFAGNNSILFAAGFYDRVHVDLFNLALQTNFRRALEYTTAYFPSLALRPNPGAGGFL